MEARHLFVKGVDGNGIFYRLEDFLVYFTITGVIVREMGLTVLAFCPMFNHVHFLLDSASLAVCRQFIQRIALFFVKEYNDEYRRTGALFKRHFGSSLKKGVKIIMGCIAYIFNNPVAGKLFGKAWEYKWNLLAYYRNDHPFSKKVRRKGCRAPMRRALLKVDYAWSKGQYLSYGMLKSILEELNQEEIRQITDYIISKYNFLSYKSLEILYGSYEKLCLAVEANAGSEYELTDEYGDHSCYRKMLQVVQSLGYKGRDLNFERLNQDELDNLIRHNIMNVKAPSSSIRKFLHIRGGG